MRKAEGTPNSPSDTIARFIQRNPEILEKYLEGDLTSTIHDVVGIALSKAVKSGPDDPLYETGNKLTIQAVEIITGEKSKPVKKG